MFVCCGVDVQSADGFEDGGAGDGGADGGLERRKHRKHRKHRGECSMDGIGARVLSFSDGYDELVSAHGQVLGVLG